MWTVDAWLMRVLRGEEFIMNWAQGRSCDILSEVLFADQDGETAVSRGHLHR